MSFLDEITEDSATGLAIKLNVLGDQMHKATRNLSAGRVYVTIETLRNWMATVREIELALKTQGDTNAEQK